MQTRGYHHLEAKRSWILAAVSTITVPNEASAESLYDQHGHARKAGQSVVKLNCFRSYYFTLDYPSIYVGNLTCAPSHGL